MSNCSSKALINSQLLIFSLQIHYFLFPNHNRILILIIILYINFRPLDINECLHNPCHANANCTNSDSSFECQCIDGFIGDGLNCTSELLAQIHYFLFPNHNLLILIITIFYISNL